MKKSEKKTNELSAILKKGNSESIIQAVTLLRDDEPFDGAIGMLVGYYDMCPDKNVLKTIEAFFNDIKDISARAEIMDEIRKPWKQSTIGMLVSSCWQSGLDYSGYITDLARIFLDADYSTAVECMTVIEESVHKSTRAVKDETISVLMESPNAFMNEKNALVHELISILQR